jgi:carbamate kinase
MIVVRPTVLAFGGNALLPDSKNPGRQEETADAFARAVGLLMTDDAGMVLVHGNGPQVGMILLRIDATKDRIPPETLDVMVAETEGSIGYLLTRTLRNRIPKKEIAAILTQVTVDPDDPGFSNPTKPVGPFYSRDTAESLKLHGWKMMETRSLGWRRVVPSPKPVEIVEIHTIEDAVGHSHLIIAGGGGGIPVVRNKGLKGVEAVIDKDLTACLLAITLRAERFVILTDVPNVLTGFGTNSEKPINCMDVATSRELLASGEFPSGSMGPKVEAAAMYAKSTGCPALITNVESLSYALRGKAGTWIEP